MTDNEWFSSLARAAMMAGALLLGARTPAVAGEAGAGEGLALRLSKGILKRVPGVGSLVSLGELLGAIL